MILTRLLKTISLGLYLFLIVAHSSIGEEAQGGQPGESTLHRVEEGETLRDIAERFLGDAESVPEILTYNGIGNPLQVKAGTLLAIPGRQRLKALAGFRQAETALQEALDARADTYARDPLRKARDALRGAEAAWRATAYLKSQAMCALATALAREAEAQAAENANVSRTWTVADMHGDCLICEGADGEWVAARKGDKAGVNSRVRTAAGARMELELPDGSRIQVNESTEVAIEQLLEDRRTSRLSTRLRLILGEMFGRIREKKTDDSVFEINSGESCTAIRGTELRMNRDRKRTCVMVLDGAVTVATARRQVAVGENECVQVFGRRLPGSAVELPPPPEVTRPAAARLETASQVLAFAWEPSVKEPYARHWKRPSLAYRFKSGIVYHIEIAEDESFNHLVENIRTPRTRVETGVLPPGDYFWRISSIDHDSMEGRWSDIGRVTIRRALDVEARPAVEPATVGGKLYIRSGVGFRVAPRGEDTSVSSSQVSVNGADYEPCADDFALRTGGEYVLRFRGVGADGQTGPPAEIRVAVDDAAPRVSLQVGHVVEHETFGQAVHVTIKAEDDVGVARTEVGIDKGDPEEYTGPLVLDAARDHVITVRAHDLVGNVSRARRFVVEAID